MRKLNQVIFSIKKNGNSWLCLEFVIKKFVIFVPAITKSDGRGFDESYLHGVMMRLVSFLAHIPSWPVIDEDGVWCMSSIYIAVVYSFNIFIYIYIMYSAANNFLVKF